MPEYGFSLTGTFPYPGIFYAVLLTKKLSNFSLLSTNKDSKHYTRNYSEWKHLQISFYFGYDGES